MDFNPIDLILHLDTYLAMLVSNYGVWIYAILFLVIFCETGLVVTPFLPGDSLLFIAGAICATGGMDPWLLGGLLMVAAITGDSTNYVIGRTLGKRLFSNPDSKVFRRDYLDRTHEFYERHGGKTVTLARFLPIVRTFAPFVAGMAKMHYPRFVMFSVVGTVAWVGGLVTLGYFFGNVPFIKNLSLLVIGIILLSLLPMILGFIRHRLQASAINRPRPRATEHVVVPRLAAPAPAGAPPGGRRALAAGTPAPADPRRPGRRRGPPARAGRAVSRRQAPDRTRRRRSRRLRPPAAGGAGATRCCTCRS